MEDFLLFLSLGEKSIHLLVGFSTITFNALPFLLLQSLINFKKGLPQIIDHKFQFVLVLNFELFHWFNLIFFFYLDLASDLIIDQREE